MKSVNAATLLIASVLIITGCNDTGKSNNTGKPGNKETNNYQDSIALIKLVRQVYKWQNKRENEIDFMPKQKNISDSLYAGIDWTGHNNRLKAIKETNYFDKEFSDNYQHIAEYIDGELKNGKTTWLVGDLSPFGYDANPWCNCQDYPDSYWNSIIISDLKIVNDNATLSWTWGSGFAYKVKASKENGSWKINYLEGFNPDNYKISKP